MKTKFIIAATLVALTLVTITTLFVFDMRDFETNRDISLSVFHEPSSLLPKPPPEFFKSLSYFNQRPQLAAAFVFTHRTAPVELTELVIYWAGADSNARYVQFFTRDTNLMLDLNVQDSNVETHVFGLSRDLIVNKDWFRMKGVAIELVESVRFLDSSKSATCDHFKVTQAIADKTKATETGILGPSAVLVLNSSEICLARLPP